MFVTMWLKTVRAEIRRQAVTHAQLYHEVAARLDGEAQRWFATVLESITREDENITTLSTMLRTKYMTQRPGPEVVDLLTARRQMRGERLVNYAQSLREIAESREIGDDRQVNAYLKGMDSTMRATHVRGHRPRTLDEDLNVAIPQVGDSGRGYCVGLEVLITAWDARKASAGRGPLATASTTAVAAPDKEQSGLGGNLGNVVDGCGPMWRSAPKQHRFYTEGQQLNSGKTDA
ncbi:hypothetical protein PHMEG_0002933 [Phytophthora megakarya]|uniref:Retrotransposon gag domain-containing protein n=1 Tax=Phytophthora megakarya TaxID=4795 RepID=A0A225WXB9_9STRA|nr:hypothetical protein PHMEG_0002933 [Phytophthora megakarya]